VVPHPERLTSENALGILRDYDVVVDGTDNFPTRYLVNDACVLLGKPNVYGSVFRWEGQLSVFSAQDGPCYRCLFREPPPPGLVPSCAEGGVLGALPGIIGTAQAMETIKLLLGVGQPLIGRLLIFDALEMSWREVALRRNPKCPVCGDEPTQTELIDYEVFCGVKPAGSSATGAHGSGGSGGSGDAADGRGFAEVDAGEVSAWVAAGEPLFLLDVRDPWEWAGGSLSEHGARLIPLGELGGRMNEIPRDRHVIAYCRSGQRSRVAAERLVEAGFSHVSSMRGGLRSWADAVDQTVQVV
jgi:adenylyltransferase/sulfurtransferase